MTDSLPSSGEDTGRTRRSLLAVGAVVVLAAAVIGVVLVGRGGELELVMADFEFRPDVIRLDADDDTQVLMMSNISTTQPHDFTVEGLPDDVSVHLALFEETLDVPYFLPAIPAGTYPVYCSLPGHRALGMEAVMVVS